MNPINLPKSGDWIYLIINDVNEKVYVGKTSKMYYRCHQYLYDFRERAIGHLNDHLFNAMRKHGIDRFEMVPWELCRDADHATERELFWMDHFVSTDRAKGYNLRRDSRSGMVTHPETSAKIRANLAKQYATGMRSDHSEKLKANWANNPERSVVQSALFRKYKTKWVYIVSVSGKQMRSMNYVDLRENGLASVLSSFHRSGLNVVEFKGRTIQRMPICLI